jgi:hypothetical protein
MSENFFLTSGPSKLCSLSIIYNIVKLTCKVKNCMTSILFWSLQPILARTFNSSLKQQEAAIHILPASFAICFKTFYPLKLNLSFLIFQRRSQKKEEIKKIFTCMMCTTYCLCNLPFSLCLPI